MFVGEWIMVGNVDDLIDFVYDYDVICCEVLDEELEIVVVDDDDLYIMYILGIIGLFKGVLYSYIIVMWVCLIINFIVDMCYVDWYMVVLLLFHVGALMFMIGNILCGVMNVVM